MSRMKWTGHMVRMKDDKFSKIYETKKHDGCRKRGIPQLRREGGLCDNEGAIHFKNESGHHILQKRFDLSVW